jgi:hypothetical protein
MVVEELIALLSVQTLTPYCRFSIRRLYFDEKTVRNILSGMTNANKEAKKSCAKYSYSDVIRAVRASDSQV